MTIKIIFIFAGILTAMASCTVYQNVQITRDKKVDFEQYQTYAWLPEADYTGGADDNDDFMRQKTRKYFIHCLTQRGLRPDTTDAQLLIHAE